MRLGVDAGPASRRRAGRAPAAAACARGRRHPSGALPVFQSTTSKRSAVVVEPCVDRVDLADDDAAVEGQVDLALDLDRPARRPTASASKVACSRARSRRPRRRRPSSSSSIASGVELVRLARRRRSGSRPRSGRACRAGSRGTAAPASAAAARTATAAGIGDEVLEAGCRHARRQRRPPPRLPAGVRRSASSSSRSRPTRPAIGRFGVAHRGGRGLDGRATRAERIERPDDPFEVVAERVLLVRGRRGQLADRRPPPRARAGRGSGSRGLVCVAQNDPLSSSACRARVTAT